MDADSSQHSAIVDAMKGKNLVIKGPPGTGKSQTITNLIASAIGNGKSVLFIADKMAALNVVYNRLQSAGLGDYCLELHSTKAKLKDIKEGLATTIANNKTAVRPPNLNRTLNELKSSQAHLRQYSNTLHQDVGSAGGTIHDNLWSEQNRRYFIQENGSVAIKKIRIEQSLAFNETKLEALIEELELLSKFETEFDKFKGDTHPWSGVNVTTSSSLKTDEIFQAFEESLECLNSVQKIMDKTQAELKWTSNETISDWKLSCSDCQNILDLNNDAMNFDLLKKLKLNSAVECARELSSSLIAADRFWFASPFNDLVKRPDDAQSRQ